MNAPQRDPLLTLEPLIDAVRSGIEDSGWELSGLQKTTSHQFEGRWEGDSTRSAYLFFHRPDVAEWASIDVYLDETSRGLAGNLALVVDSRLLSGLGDVPSALQTLGSISADALPEGYRTPLTLRLRLDRGQEAGQASSEIRFKLRIPRAAFQAGAGSVAALAGTTVSAFQELLSDERLSTFLDTEQDAHAGPTPSDP
jgi:hypothetical protein